MKQFLKKIFEMGQGREPVDPSIFHITHYKSGSQWVYAVLAQMAEKRIVIPEVAAAHYTRGGIVPGKIYPCVYLTKKQFKEIKRPRRSRCFVVIRDLRDTLISQYFSVKASHEILYPQMQRFRDRLSAMSLTEGLQHMINNNIYRSADIQRSWINDRKILLIKYEDLIADEQVVFNRVFDYCGMVSDETVRKVAIEEHSFEKRAGRKPGQEDAGSHHRKGIAGDWKNYFDDHLKDAFKEKHAKLLIDTGYEKDDAW